MRNEQGFADVTEALWIYAVGLAAVMSAVTMGIFIAHRFGLC